MIGQITISQAWLWIIGAMSSILTIDKVVDLFKRWFGKKPDKELEDRVKNTEEFQMVMCRVMLAQLNHELSGNDVSHLREARDELNNYLTRRNA